MGRVKYKEWNAEEHIENSRGETLAVQEFREKAGKLGILEGVVSNVVAEGRGVMGFRLQEIMESSGKRLIFVGNDVLGLSSIDIANDDYVYVLARAVGNEYDCAAVGLANKTTGRVYGHKNRQGCKKFI